MSRVVTVVLASLLVGSALLQSELLPLCLLTMIGAGVGFVVATQTKESRHLLRVPVLVALAVLMLVGVGQLGVLGILLGVALRITATPTESVRSPSSGRQPRG